MTAQPFPTGALPTPPEKLALGWPISLALAAAPIAAPAKFHHPGCGPTLNQSPFGACVGYGTTSAHAAQELADEGTRTPSGRRSLAWGAHGPECCTIEEHEVRAVTVRVP